MHRLNRRLAWTLALVLVATPLAGAGERTVVVETDEVTEPALSLSPDGTTLYLSILGDLVALGADGGEVRALSSGPSYDAFPVVSRDGRWLYFVSDRGDHVDRVYRRDLETDQVVALELPAAAPPPGPPRRPVEPRIVQLAVAPAGDAVAAMVRSGSSTSLVLWSLVDGTARSLPGARCPSFLDDGRLVVAQPPHDKRWTLSALPLPGGKSEVLYEATEGCQIEFAAVAPDGHHAVVGEGRWTHSGRHFEELLVVDLEHGEVLLRKPHGPVRNESFLGRAAFGPGRVYLPDHGRIRVFDLETNELTALPFHARLEHQLPARLDRAVRPASHSRARSVAQGVAAVRPSPTGEAVVFSLHGDLYVCEDGETAWALTEGPAEDGSPWFTLDGETVLFSRDGTLARVDLVTQEVETLEVEVGPSFELHPDGTHLLTATDLVDLGDDSRRQIAAESMRWRPGLAFGAEGGEIVFTRLEGVVGQAFVQSLDGRGARPLTRLERSVSLARASADGRFLAVLRDGRAWLGERSPEPLGEADLAPLGPVGAHDLVFSGDSAVLWVVSGASVTAYETGSGAPLLTWDLSIPTTRQDPPPPLVLRAVHVVDVERGAILDSRRVVIEDGRIRSILPEEEAGPVPANATVFDGAGGFLIPGLVDWHVHGPDRLLGPMLAWGVTATRDVGGGWTHSWDAAERVSLRGEPGPQVVLAGEIFEGATPFWGNAFHAVDDVDEGLALLEHRAASGMDLVKVYPSLPRAIRVPLLARARQLGLPSAGHSDDLPRMVRSIGDGLDCFEHVPGRPIFGDVIALLEASGTAWCPTLCVMGGGDRKLRHAPEQYAASRFTGAVPDWHLEGSRARPYYAWSSDENLRALLQERAEVVVRAARAGVPVFVGSDAPNSNCFHGPSTHWEMEFLVQGGMTAAEALRAATLVPREVYGLPGGRIREGAPADLVLLGANPLDDVRHTREIRRVVRAGRLFDPEELLDGEE